MITENSPYYSDVLNSLKQHKFFGLFNENQVHDLLKISEIKDYDRKTTLIEQESKNEYVFFIVKGLAKICLEENNKTFIISLVPQNKIAGLFSVFGSNPNTYSTCTLVKTTALVIPIRQFHAFLQKHPALLLEFNHYFTDISSKLFSKMLFFNKKNIKGKVAYVLLYVYNEILKTKKMYLPISRREYAELAAISPENVIRTLSEFNKEGILKVRNRDIEILDMEKLRKIAQYG